MPTRGTRHTTIRLSPEMLKQINDEVAKLNSRLRRPRWNLTEFIRMAVEERLAKLDRGRKTAGKRRAAGEQDGAEEGGELVQAGPVEQGRAEAAGEQRDGTEG